MPDEKPPLLVKIHGGPTAACSAAFDLRIQYWTSRGARTSHASPSVTTGAIISCVACNMCAAAAAVGLPLRARTFDGVAVDDSVRRVHHRTCPSTHSLVRRVCGGGHQLWRQHRFRAQIQKEIGGQVGARLCSACASLTSCRGGFKMSPWR